MKVLIAKQNESVIRDIIPTITFIESTKNTSIFKIGEKGFSHLYSKVIELGYNPYSLMYW